MVRRLCVLFLGATFAFAQEGADRKEGDDEGISIDDAPAGPGERTTPFPAREPGKEVGTVVIKSKVYTLAVPADWVLIDEEDSDAELTWEMLLPGSAKRATLKLFRVGGDPRSSPYYQAGWTREDTPGARTEVKLDRCPRLVAFRSVDGSDRVEASFYRSILNNPYAFQLSCAAADFPQAEADMLNAVQSFTADVETWPAIPKEYKRSRHGIWLLARAPDVTAPAEPILKALQEYEQRFLRDHGALAEGDTPIVVLLMASRGAFGTVEEGTATSEFDVVGQAWERRILVVPFPKYDAKQQGWFAYETRQTLWTVKYGDIRPEWIYAGEAFAAKAEEEAGAPLPSVDEELATWASSHRLHRVDELEKLGDTDPAAYYRECLFYVAALRGGKHQERYRAFLDLAGTGDALGAYERHLAPIDQEDLRSSTQDFISKAIKPVKQGKKG